MRLIEASRSVTYNLIIGAKDLDDLVEGRILAINIDGTTVYLKYGVQ